MMKFDKNILEAAEELCEMCVKSRSEKNGLEKFSERQKKLREKMSEWFGFGDKW